MTSAGKSAGREVFGKYRLSRRLAFGGMAEIFLGSLTGEGGFTKKVVLKRILPQFCSDPSFVQMFIDEAVIAARLTHPNIVQVYDFGEIEGTYFIAMEWVDGVDLSHLIKTMGAAGERLSPVEVAALGEGICKGLCHAHDFRDDEGAPLNIVHRDISPHNIMLSRSGEAKVMDFGIAKAEQRATHTQTGMIKGKIAYMAPEQARGEAIDKRSDQFSVGLVLWECATGERLYSGDSDMEMLRLVGHCETRLPTCLRDDFPAPLEQIIMQALAPQAEDRYSGLGEMELALSAWRFSLGARGAVQLGSLVDRLAPRRLTGTIDRRTRAVTGSEPGGTVAIAGAGELAGSALDSTGPIDSCQPDSGWDAAGGRRTQWGGTAAADPVRDTWSDDGELPTQMTASAPSSLANAKGGTWIEVESPLPAASEAIAAAKRGRGPWLAAGLTAAVALLLLIALGLLPRLTEEPGAETAVVEVPLAERAPVIGVLMIESDPPGAAISIGGTPIGLETPAPIPGQKIGQILRIGLHLAGHAPAERDVLLTAAQQRFTATLLPLSPPAPVPAPSPKADSPTPRRVDLKPVVKRGRVAPPPGRLSVRARGGWVEVFLGKRKLGTTPVTGVELPAGTHTLRLQNRDRGFKKTLRVTIESGGHLKQTIDLE